MKPDYKVNLESLLLGYYIKYDRLLMMCQDSLANMQGNIVDIYIDLYDMLKPVYTQNIYANNTRAITSAVINLVAHMRGYFRSRHRINTRFYLVYAEELSMQHQQFAINFGDNSFRATMNYDKNYTMVKTQLELVKILAAYIPEVYYIHRESDFSMFVYGNIASRPNIIPAIILTKSMYAYLLPSLFENAYIFRPKKSKGEDQSYVVKHSNVLVSYFTPKSPANIEKLNFMHPSLLSLMMALCGLPNYNFYIVVNITTAAKMVYNAIQENRLMNGRMADTDFIHEALNLSNVIDPTNFRYRFNAVDLPFQYSIYASTPEAMDISWQIDLYDPESVKYINNKYFVNNPLDLNNL